MKGHPIVRAPSAPRLRPEEALAHSTEGDVWVAVFGQVLDVSDLASPSPSGCLAARTLFAFAGKDMSHCFDPDSRDVLTFVHPATGLTAPTAAVRPAAAASARVQDRAVAWWRDPCRLRGRLTERARPIRVVDSFSGLAVLLWVCREDTLARVLERYGDYNGDVARYDCVLAGTGRALDPARTLDENGIPDERDVFVLLGLPEDLYVPAVMLVRRDDGGDVDGVLGPAATSLP